MEVNKNHEIFLQNNSSSVKKEEKTAPPSAPMVKAHQAIHGEDTAIGKVSFTSRKKFDGASKHTKSHGLDVNKLTSAVRRRET